MDANPSLIWLVPHRPLIKTDSGVRADSIVLPTAWPLGAQSNHSRNRRKTHTSKLISASIVDVKGFLLEIEGFLKDIRQCLFCRADMTNRGGTPFVYGSANPDIMVVSEMPPGSAWKEDIGALWAKEDLFAARATGAPHRLCQWLGIDQNAAKRRFMWIQRANCTVTIGKRFAFQHCSSKYIDRAIDLIKPKLILILGRVAAEYFFPFGKTKEVMGKTKNYRGYECIVLYHPSRAAQKYQHRAEQKKSIMLAKQKLSSLVN